VFVAVLVAVLFGDWSLSTPPPLHNKVKHMDTPPERKNCNGWSRINTFNVPNNAHLRDQEDFYQISELRKKATKKNQNQKSKLKNANIKTTKPKLVPRTTNYHVSKLGHIPPTNPVTDLPKTSTTEPTPPVLATV
jgi:hypothetical protein